MHTEESVRIASIPGRATWEQREMTCRAARRLAWKLEQLAADRSIGTQDDNAADDDRFRLVYAQLRSLLASLPLGDR